VLTELIIRNFAIIDRLQVAFGSGFGVLTGETGAGKSIIIDAVGLLLGERARPELIRTGEEEATVEALFDLAGRPDLQSAVAEAGFEATDELVLKRTVSRSGRNRVYVNGSLATLSQLQPLSGRLVTIYGQHEHQGLLRADGHLPLLDRFAGLEDAAEGYQQLHRQVLALEERLRQLAGAERERQQRLDLLAYQSREIADARLVPGEDEELAAERLLLQNAGRLAAVTSRGYETLYGEQGAVCERLGRTADELSEMAKIDPALGQIAETLRSSLYALEDAAAQLRDHGRRIAFEPGRQQEVEERLALIASLKRKYAPTLEEILAFAETIGRELAELTDLDATRDALQRQLAEAQAQRAAAGDALSVRRKAAAVRLAQAVEAELQGLAMPRARFEVRLTPLAGPGARGLERGEFLIAPNPGEEPKPLARIASGGELSRLMLALKRAAPDGEGIPTLIFDEVDAGIGGVAATAVGEKLRAAARSSQVLCITHLPQVAAFADRHHRVEKAEEGGRTRTRLVELEGEERVREMARMLGGARVTDRTLEHAREMIAHGSWPGADPPVP
jgi:DNA repair protein RecN (Recombination protein N)